MASYVDLPSFKAYLDIQDSGRDDQLTAVLEAASRHIDELTGRTFALDEELSAREMRTRGRVVRDSARFDLVLADGDGLLVDDIGDVTGLAVETGAAGGIWSTYTGWSADPVSPGRPVTVLRGRWTTPLVRITALWGWPAVPAAIARATLIQAARLHKRKGSPEGIAGSAEWGAVRVSRTDPDVEALVSPYMLPAFA